MRQPEKWKAGYRSPAWVAIKGNNNRSRKKAFSVSRNVQQNGNQSFSVCSNQYSQLDIDVLSSDKTEFNRIKPNEIKSNSLI